MSSNSCQESTMTITKPVSPFLKLPGEIRNLIYDYLLEPPDLKRLFAIHLRKWQKMEDLWTQSHRPSVCFFSPRVDALVTPAILLLNRQISLEAVSFLRAKPLVISSPPPRSAQLGRDSWITEFISEPTLRKLHHVVLEMDLSLHSWFDTIETLFEVWGPDNKLKSLHVRLKWTHHLGLVTTTRVASPHHVMPRIHSMVSRSHR